MIPGVVAPLVMKEDSDEPPLEIGITGCNLIRMPVPAADPATPFVIPHTKIWSPNLAPNGMYKMVGSAAVASGVKIKYLVLTSIGDDTLPAGLDVDVT